MQTVIRTRVDGYAAELRLRPEAINLFQEATGPHERFFSVSFDASGRLLGAFLGGRNYRRSLDNRILQKWSDRTGNRRHRLRRWLPEAEARAAVTDAYRLLAQAIGNAESNPVHPVSWEPLSNWLARPEDAWAWLQADARRFQAIYKPVGILPPDQYLALVLQATEGCSHNACTFCDFYRDRPFRIKTPQEFDRHVQAVVGFFGPALNLRKSLFLGDANALIVPQERLLDLWQVLERHFAIGPGPEQRRIYGFVDAFGAGRKSVHRWQELAARGLYRVYIGMESGADGLLRWLNKPGDSRDVVEAVLALKAAGVQVSIIVLLGAGGQRFAGAHVAGTVAALNAMPLGRGDLVYFSDLVVQPGGAYQRRALEEQVQPLDEEERRAQEAAIRRAFRPQDPGHLPQFSRYDIREFLY